MKKLGFGLMRLPLLDESNRKTINVELVEKMVDLYMQRGFTYFDTAFPYHDGNSGIAIREALTKRYPREQYWLADKITMRFIKDEAHQKEFFMQQLADCGVEYFDNYLVHNMGESSYPTAQRLHSFEFVEEMKRLGLTKNVGFSFHGTPELLEKILTDHPNMDYVQLQINYLDWEDSVIRSRECYEIARRHDKKIIVMEPIKGSRLINLPDAALMLLKAHDYTASPAVYALRYAASLEGVEMVLSGMSALEQVDENTASFADFQPLSEIEFALLEEIATLIRKESAIECTGCHYCTRGCPAKIGIPEYFALYNNMKRLKNTSYLINQHSYYANLSQIYGKANECIKCGQCESACPQKLPIRDLLAQVSAVFDK